MKEYLEYLKNEKHKSANTLIAYERDIKALQKFLDNRNKRDVAECTETDAVAFVIELSNLNKSRPTIVRMISSNRRFFEYEILKGRRTDNPFAKVKSAKVDKRQIDFLTIEEVFKLLELPGTDRKGIRDRALLEFMYGTGARVTELTRLKVSDINLRMNFATLKDGDAESRIVPIGSYAHDALLDYFDNAYASYNKGLPEPNDPLFLSQRGTSITRQGVWKILKEYGEQIGLGDRMTPQILRDSFAVHILQNGGDLKTLQELMGFENMTVGIAYLSVTNIRVKDVYTRTHPRA